MPVDLSKHHFGKGLALEKLARAETLLEMIVSYATNRKKAESELKITYADLWVQGMQKHKVLIFEECILTEQFIDEFSDGAAHAVTVLLDTDFYFLQRVLEKELGNAHVTDPRYYQRILLMNPSPDPSSCTGLANHVLQTFDKLYHAHVAQKIKIQLEDPGLKSYFLDGYGELFKGYEIIELTTLNEMMLCEYLFLLGENKLDDYVRQQPRGMEQIRKIKEAPVSPPPKEPENGQNNPGTGS